MKVAGRFKPCVHMGCFDLKTFVELNQRSRKVSTAFVAYPPYICVHVCVYVFISTFFLLI